MNRRKFVVFTKIHEITRERSASLQTKLYIIQMRM